MKRIFSLLVTLCMLAACLPAGAESPAFTEGERKAMDLLAQELEKDAERQIAAMGEVTDLYPDMLSGKHITFPELPRGSSFFDTKKHLRRGAHAYSFVSLTSEIPCYRILQ